MNIIDCAQRSPDWIALRLGTPTASRFADIVTPTGKPCTGATPRRYMLELLGERLTGLPTPHFETAAMARGTDLEPKAKQYYELTTGRTVRNVGLVMHETLRCGCSPDGLCADRGIEVKCPIEPGFMDIAESGKVPPDHILQVQACMWLTGLARWDYLCYTDVRGLLPIIIECERDVALHAAFDTILPMFCEKLDEAEKRLRAAGHGIQQKGIRNDDGFDDPFSN